MQRVHIYYEVIYMDFLHLQYLIEFYCIIWIYLQDSPKFQKYGYIFYCTLAIVLLKSIPIFVVGFSHIWNCVFLSSSLVKVRRVFYICNEFGFI